MSAAATNSPAEKRPFAQRHPLLEAAGVMLVAAGLLTLMLALRTLSDVSSLPSYGVNSEALRVPDWGTTWQGYQPEIFYAAFWVFVCRVMINFLSARPLTVAVCAIAAVFGCTGDWQGYWHSYCAWSAYIFGTFLFCHAVYIAKQGIYGANSIVTCFVWALLVLVQPSANAHFLYLRPSSYPAILPAIIATANFLILLAACKERFMPQCTVTSHIKPSVEPKS